MMTTQRPLDADDSENLAAARLFQGACDFFRAASEIEHLPPEETRMLPEVAFWGRSNVGKSSLINGLTGRKGLARTSNTPGRTQQIVFFNLAQRLMLADMPGYGHAEAPKKIIEQWNRLIRHYLSTRPHLRCVCLLVDARHGALKADLEMMSLLDCYAVSYQIVLTKGDYLGAAARIERIEGLKKIIKKHPAARPEIIVTSASKKEGLDEVRKILAAYALSV